MPSVGKSSSRAGIHPYLRKDFEWPIIESDQTKVLCAANDIKFHEKRFDEFRAKRTFYLNERLCKLFKVDYYTRGAKLIVTKHMVKGNPLVQMIWDFDHLKRWSKLQEGPGDKITLVNNGTSWWTAETTWIKMK